MMRALEVFSDIACPWCFIGMRRLERALGSMSTKERPKIRWRAFLLQPDFPMDTSSSARAILERRFGGGERFQRMFAQVASLGKIEGIHFDLDRQMACNTILAHRAVAIARSSGTDHLVMERMFRAFFEEGADLSKPRTVLQLLTEVLPAGERSKWQDASVLTSGDAVDDVENDRRLAMQLGVQGVPFFVLDRRFAMSGAQDVETFLGFLRSAAIEGPV